MRMTRAAAEVRGQVLRRLLELHSERDIESAHSEADNLLLKLLESLGLSDIVDAYDDVPKWYA